MPFTILTVGGGGGGGGGGGSSQRIVLGENGISRGVKGWGSMELCFLVFYTVILIIYYLILNSCAQGWVITDFYSHCKVEV